MNKEIIKLIEERLDIGAKRYGSEDIKENGRNFIQEALEEVLDCMIYSAYKLIQLNKGQYKRRRNGKAL